MSIIDLKKKFSSCVPCIVSKEYKKVPAAAALSAAAVAVGAGAQRWCWHQAAPPGPPIAQPSSVTKNNPYIYNYIDFNN